MTSGFLKLILLGGSVKLVYFRGVSILLMIQQNQYHFMRFATYGTLLSAFVLLLAACGNKGSQQGDQLFSQENTKKPLASIPSTLSTILMISSRSTTADGRTKNSASSTNQWRTTKRRWTSILKM